MLYFNPELPVSSSNQVELSSPFFISLCIGYQVRVLLHYDLLLRLIPCKITFLIRYVYAMASSPMKS